MFTKFNTKYKTIFIDPQSSHIEVDEKVNVILSPALYWVKKLSLPMKYIRDVKKLLPSVFEDLIPEGHYSYTAYRSGDDFFVFAYEDKKILDTLAQKGISSSNIANVYFAQSEFESFKEPVKANATQSIYKKDDIFILVPSAFLSQSQTLSVENIPLSAQSIALAQFGHIVDSKSLSKIAAVFVVLLLLLVSELFVTSQKVSEIEANKEALFAQGGVKSTMFENNAILKKQKTIYEKQTKLRAAMALVLSARLAKDERLKEVSFKTKSFVAEFSSLSAPTVQSIEKELIASGVTYKATQKNEAWRLEVSL